MLAISPGRRRRRGESQGGRTWPEMKKVLSIEASMGAAAWRESAGTESAEAVKAGVPCCVVFDLRAL